MDEVYIAEYRLFQNVSSGPERNSLIVMNMHGRDSFENKRKG